MEVKIMNKKFFMVFVEGENTPTVQHDNLDEAEEINVKVDTFEKAIEYLGRENKACISGIPYKHAKAMAAMYKLITIAEAWNKADNFIPDYDNTNQYKWFPWFQKRGTAGFSPVSSDYTTSYAAASLGSQLCLSTRERAKQFGKQFIDLWNDFLFN